LVGIIILIPVFVVIAVLVKLDSSGPVLYRGIRAGRHGKVFRIFKFRTMVDNAEKLGGGTTALDDPRVTRVGAFLREYKLDEFPQLFNVIKGEMSIVGPRPELLQYTLKYSESEKCILDVKPGITDFSSIKFASLDKAVGSEDADRTYEENVLHEKNRLRIKYVKERSLMLDMKLVILTVWLILSKIVKQ